MNCGCCDEPEESEFLKDYRKGLIHLATEELDRRRDHYLDMVRCLNDELRKRRYNE